MLLSAEKPFTRRIALGRDVLLHVHGCRANRDINEHYPFDAVVASRSSRSSLSNAAAEHRVVATGSYAGPWGFMFAGKLTWSTPIPHATSISCYAAPGHSSRTARPAPRSRTSRTNDGYQALDLQITKNFEIGDIGSMYLRLDVLNVTNEHNLVDFIDANGPNGLVIGGRYNPDGNITGVPRTVRMTLRREVLSRDNGLGC